MTDKNNKESTKEIVKKNEAMPEVSNDKTISLTKIHALDLTGLDEDQISELKRKHAEGMIEVGIKAAELSAHTQALGGKLAKMGESTKEVSESGGSVTITNVSEDAIGRTEIIMGDSEAAKKGKLTRSQAGVKDYTLVWVGLAVFVIIVVAIIMLH